MSKLADRKAECRVLANEMTKRYEAMVCAVGEEETTITATELAIVFNKNIEVVLWALRKAGGATNNPI